jgi:hypothetical protein
MIFSKKVDEGIMLYSYLDSPSDGRFNKRGASTCSELASRIKILEAFFSMTG